jgi:3-oxosteroid 1-dehydrogenase
MGMSLVGQLLNLCLQEGIQIETHCGLKELVVTGGAVTSAKVVQNGEEKVIEAKRSVILAAGGFARNSELRKKHQDEFGASARTLTGPEDQGDAITAAISVGAATELMNEAWWGPTLVDNTGKPYWTQFERALPHSMVVDEAWNRFANEAEAYTRFIHNLFEHQQKTGRGVPAFLILDSNHRDRYVLSDMMPGKIAQWALDCGLYLKADTLDEVAQKLGIDAKGLKATTKRFNEITSTGVDRYFERGRSPYD